MKTSKIEKYGLEDIVKAGIKNEKSSRVIAQECTAELQRRGIDDTISHKAVNDYMKFLKTAGKKARMDVVQRNRSVQLKLINTEIDIIQTAARTTNALLERFDFIDALPNTLQSRLEGLKELTSDPDEWGRWGAVFMDDIKKNIAAIAALNREVRENSKFMVELREKAYEFNLIQEFLSIYMEIFRSVDQTAHEAALTKIAINPRLQRIVEQQRELKGYEDPAERTRTE